MADKFVERKDDVLYQAYEYRGETYHRFQEIVDIEEVNIGDSGELLFDVDFDRLLKTDIIPQEKKEETCLIASYE